MKWQDNQVLFAFLTALGLATFAWALSFLIGKIKQFLSKPRAGSNFVQDIALATGLLFVMLLLMQSYLSQEGLLK